MKKKILIFLIIFKFTFKHKKIELNFKVQTAIFYYYFVRKIAKKTFAEFLLLLNK